MAQAETRQALDFALTRIRPQQPWACRQIIVRTQGMTRDLSFDPPRPLSDVLAPSVAQAMLSDQFLRGSDPHFFLGGVDFMVQGIRLEVSDDTGQARLSLPQVSGDPMALLHMDLRGQTRQPEVDDLCRQILEDLLRPALSIYDHLLEHGLSDLNAAILQARLKTMKAQREQLGDHVEMLQAVGDLARLGAPAANLDTGPEPATPSAAPVRRRRGKVPFDLARCKARALEATVLFGHQHDLLSRTRQ